MIRYIDIELIYRYWQSKHHYTVCFMWAGLFDW